MFTYSLVHIGRYRALPIMCIILYMCIGPSTYLLFLLTTLPYKGEDSWPLVVKHVYL